MERPTSPLNCQLLQESGELLVKQLFQWKSTLGWLLERGKGLLVDRAPQFLKNTAVEKAKKQKKSYF